MRPNLSISGGVTTQESTLFYTITSKGEFDEIKDDFAPLID